MTTVGGGCAVVVFQRTYKRIGAWQEGRRDVDSKDHKLLHEMADVMMDRPSGPFNKGSLGIVSRVGNLETIVSGVKDTVDQILHKLENQ